MALTYSLDDFAVTFFVTGNGFSTLSVEIYSLARRGISLNINALSTLLFALTLLLVVVYYFITQRVRQTGMGETMKRLVQMFLIISLVSALLLYAISRLNSSQGFTSNNTLTIYNWGDYIDTDLIDRFEEETGIKVIYETFDSNEAMMTKIEQGGTTYDIAIPSEYMIDKMRQEDLLVPLDHSKLPNLKNIDERFINLPFDPENKYSVPYFWGTVGIVYNSKMLGGKEITAWADLWDKDLKMKYF